ncbi:MAG: hypothetical protein GY754_25605 [bacterium]|nr:hypothetical protein [bacterium]
MRTILIILLCSLTSCISYSYNKTVLAVDKAESEQAWSRAHSFIAQNLSEPVATSDYVLVYDEEHRRITVIREIGSNKDKLYLIERKMSTHDSSKPSWDLLLLESYIRKGKVNAFNNSSKKKRFSDKVYLHADYLNSK